MAGTWKFHTLSSRIYRLVGADGRDLLQRISTADLSQLAPHAPVATLLTNEKGRVVDLAAVSLEAEGSLLLTGIGDHDGRVQRWLERYVIMEDVRILDVTREVSVAASYAADTSGTWRMPDAVALFSVPVGMGRHVWGLTVLSKEAGRSVDQHLAPLGGSSVDATTFLRDRVAAGVPWLGPEIGEARHPLEARLRPLISFTKGCYIGQEVIARLDTYRKVQMVLTRFEGAISDAEEAPIELHTEGGTAAGVITSIARGPGPICGLGYVRPGLLGGTASFHSARGTTVRPVDTNPTQDVYD